MLLNDMILDSLPEMQKLDQEGVYLSITSLPDQMRASWQGVQDMSLPPEYKLVRNVVVAGMGGSGLAARMVHSLFFNTLSTPFEICNEYSLPNYVNENTLVILSSYSGNTEETISAAHEAQSRGALIFGMATGGKLAQFLKDEELPGYIYDPKYNPSGQPRMSLGYQTTALISLLSKLAILQVRHEDMSLLIDKIAKLVHQFEARTPANENPAKLLAQKLKDKSPVFISSEHLFEVAHVNKNQMNENAKTFALHFGIPELNHHLMEGLKFPESAKHMLHFVFYNSKLYSDRVKLRYPITAEVIEKNGYQHSIYELQSTTKMEQAFELLILGSFLSFYLAILYGINPSPIPWVDYFKEKLT